MNTPPVTVIQLTYNSPEFNEIINAVKKQTRLTTMEEMELHADVWLSNEEAMEYLKITSSTTLYKYRDEPDSPIVCSQPSQRDCKWLKKSLHEYLMKKSNKANY